MLGASGVLLGLAFGAREVEVRHLNEEGQCQEYVFLLHGVWHLLTAWAFYLLAVFVALFSGPSVSQEWSRVCSHEGHEERLVHRIITLPRLG